VPYDDNLRPEKEVCLLAIKTCQNEITTKKEQSNYHFYWLGSNLEEQSKESMRIHLEPADTGPGLFTPLPG